MSIKGRVTMLLEVSLWWDGLELLMQEGFITQELSQIIPDAVHQPVNPDHLQTLKYDALIAVLVKAVQELSAEVTALKNGSQTT